MGKSGEISTEPLTLSKKDNNDSETKEIKEKSKTEAILNIERSLATGISRDSATKTKNPGLLYKKAQTLTSGTENSNLSKSNKQDNTIINNNYNININVDKEMKHIISENKGVNLIINNNRSKSITNDAVSMKININGLPNRNINNFDNAVKHLDEDSYLDEEEKKLKIAEEVRKKRNSNYMKRSEVNDILAKENIDSHKTENLNNKVNEVKSKIKTNILDTMMVDDYIKEEDIPDSDCFESISEEIMSGLSDEEEEEEEDIVNDLNDLDGSFLKEMLKETNKQYIKQQESNEEKLQKLSGRMVFLT